MEGPAVLERAAATILDDAGPTRAERLALRVVQIGAVAVVLAATTWREFELDRFFAAKELALHLTALVAGLLLLRTAGRTRIGRVDTLLLLFLLLSAVSAATATNPWLAGRAVAISVSGVVLFRVARALARAGLARPLLGALALAVVVGAATALLQAYGVRSDLFSINRAPGGTLGNRNFIAHMAAFGLPLVLFVALRARHTAGYLLATAGAMLVVASLILTRSRAGWLAAGAVMVVIAFALVASPSLRRDGRTWLRLAGILALAGAAVAAALTLPNSLRWRGDNPYLESVMGVANYQDGSGRGRLIQYEHSLRMAAGHPFFGVGPGNWAVVYPDHAARGDPSMDRSEGGMTSNPWPSSDWVAFLSERGLPAALLLAGALLGIALSALRRLRRAFDADDALAGAAVLGTIAAAVVAGTFDAVLLLALPSFIVWAALGALWTPAPPTDATNATNATNPMHTTRVASAPYGARRATAGAFVLGLLVILAGAGAARSTTQLIGMGIYAAGEPGWLRYAARVDPGNYRVHLRLARSGAREQRCRHAAAAHALYPHASAARTLDRRCGN